MSSTWKAIRLELTATREFPTGSAGRAYHLQLPLDHVGAIDDGAFDEHPHKATFRRHWASDRDESGLVHRHGPNWALRSPGQPDRTLAFASQWLRQGLLAFLMEHDGATLPLQIVSIR